jgi:hypothetical protein
VSGPPDRGGNPLPGAVHPLVEQVLAGGNRQLQELGAAGLLPLPPDQLIPLQVALTRGKDLDLAQRARESLQSLEPRVAAPYLERDAGPQEIAFFARETSHPLVIETILRRRDVPRAVLMDLAQRLPAEMQEILLLRQDAILDEPAILTALERNVQLTPYSQRRIIEYKQHLLPQRFGVRAADAARELIEVDDEVVAAAIAEVKELDPQGEIEEFTGLSEGQIRMLAVPVRIRLSRNASRVMKNILLRDSSPLVALSVLRSNSFSDAELEHLSRSRSVIEDVLEEIARHRDWVGKYAISKALIQNPRTPIRIALRLLPKLGLRDLRELTRDRNVADAVRSNAQRLYRIKQQ